jgi:exopolyphosphatase/guanosine-5'-triphosphate,3'-diphosphate pyrophosphatase
MSAKPQTIAAIDIGSSTVHLSILKAGPGKRLKHIRSATEILGLGRTAQINKHLPPAAIRRVRATLKDFVKIAKREKVSSILIGATEALRRASNGQEVLNALSLDIGVPIRLLAPERECALTFEGVRSTLPLGSRYLFVDSGGGSTQITLADGRQPVGWASLALGSASLSVALNDDPPGPLELARLMPIIQEALRKAPNDMKPQKAVFAGGSARRLGALAEASPARLTRNEIELALRRLMNKRSEKLSDKYGVRHDRVKLLTPGALILGSILDHYGLKQAAITQRGLRDGMVLAYLKNGDKWWTASWW